mmetsp:Transcript_5414/g.15329  ORF Transcript_5414/g.15329 Transcript_5414/m.15329 type:complete len:247 (-) Transcript_5414:2704-3444(-)
MHFPFCELRPTMFLTCFPYFPCVEAFDFLDALSSSSFGSMRCRCASSSQPFWKRYERYVNGVDSYHRPREVMWCWAMKETRRLWCCQTSPIFPSTSLGFSSPHMRLSSVDLPAPLTPTSATRLARLSLALTPLITCPLPPAYSKYTSRISITGFVLVRIPSSFPGIGNTSFIGAAFGSSTIRSTAGASGSAASFSAEGGPSSSAGAAFSAALAALSRSRDMFPASRTSASSSEMAFACLNASKLPL